MNTLVEAGLLKFGVNEGLGVSFDAEDGDVGFDLRWMREMPARTPGLERIINAVFGENIETLIANPLVKLGPTDHPQGVRSSWCPAIRPGLRCDGKFSFPHKP